MPASTMAGAADFLLTTLIIFAVGRIAGAVMMIWIDPMRLLAGFATSGIVLGLVATFVQGEVGVWAMVASSFSMSIMFATVLGTAIKDLGPLIKVGTALVYLGGAGSAVGVAAMHLIWTYSSIHLAMVIPTLGYTGVLIFALARLRYKPAVEKAAAPAVAG